MSDVIFHVAQRKQKGIYRKCKEDNLQQVLAEVKDGGRCK
jgi:hypothetical protein